ncbi:hypothetical protein Tco_0564665 [Tanacetum coccineum]
MVAYLQKSKGSEGFHQIVDFLTASHIRYALTESPTIHVSLIEQFWQTATVSTLENRDMEITATIDGKVKVVSEASIRRHLKQETKVPQPSSPTQTYVANEAASTGVDLRHRGAATIVSILDARQGNGNINKTPAMPYDSPLPRVHTLGSNEGRRKHNELMDLVTKLSDKMGAQTHGRHDHEMKDDFEFTTIEDVSTANVSVNTAGAEISTTSPKFKTAGVFVDDIAAEGLVYIRRSAAKIKDKGIAIMKEFEPTHTKTKIQQE